MDSLLREKLTQLTEKCEILQKNNKYPECIDIMEEIVNIKKNVYGMDHHEFDKSSEKLCEYLNMAAMVELQLESFDSTIDYLRKAELVCRNSLVLKSTTFNNMACYYRRTGKIRTALSYLIQALNLELQLENPKTLADIHINLCAVLSQLDKHDDALQHSMLAIILLQDEFLEKFLKKYNEDETESQKDGKEEMELSDERLAVLAIAYHNMGVEFEHLKRFSEALKIYEKALTFSKENLSNNEQLVKNLTKVVNSATQQIEEQKKNVVEYKTSRLDLFVPESKDIYKELSKTVERYRHLPKIKVNSKEATSFENPYNPISNLESIGSLSSIKNRSGRDSIVYDMYNADKTNRENSKSFNDRKGRIGEITKYRFDVGNSNKKDSGLKGRESMEKRRKASSRIEGG